MKTTVRCKCGEEIEITDQLDTDLRLIADHQAAENERLRDAIAFLRGHVQQNAGACDPFTYVWQRIWEEFERKLEG